MNNQLEQIKQKYNYDQKSLVMPENEVTDKGSQDRSKLFNDAFSSTENTPNSKSEPSFLSNMKDAAVNNITSPFVNRMNEVSDRALNANQSSVSNTLQTVGALAGTALDISLGKGFDMAKEGIKSAQDYAKGFSDYVPKSIANINNDVVPTVVGRAVDKTYQATKSSIDEVINKINQITQGHPEAAGNIGAALNIAGVLPGEGAVRAASSKILDTGKAVAEATPAILNKAIDTTKQALPTIDKARESAINSLEDTYTALNSGTQLGKKTTSKIIDRTEGMNKAGTTGKTPMRTLAENGITPNLDGTKLSTYEQAAEYKDSIKPLIQASKTALDEVGMSSMPLSLNKLEEDALRYAKTSENVNSGRYENMAKNISSEFDKLKEHYSSGNIPIGVVDDIKSARWDNVFKNKGLVEVDALKKNSEYAMAKSLQKNIEDAASQAGHEDVAQLNREIGDRLEASKFLQDLDGKTVKGGRLLKYVTTAIGANAGSGLLGKAIGGLGGNLAGQILINAQVSNPVKRLLLRNLAVKDPEAYTKTLQWIQEQQVAREGRLALPASKSIIVPNTQGTPNPISRPYVANEQGAVGGVVQRIKGHLI